MATSSQSAVLSFADARHVVDTHSAQIPAPATESLDLLASLHRVLAEEVPADRDLPPFPRATRDGFAVRASDLASVPAHLRLIGEVRAGASFDRELQPGEAVSIMTGAPVPSGADAVVMVEYTSTSDDTVEITRGITSGENVVPRGSEARAGATLLSPGTRISYAAIAAAASVGRTSLTVYRKPRVAILSTGDEVVSIDATPGPTQIRNSNSYSLAAQLANAGGEPVILPIAPDERIQLRRLIETGLHEDLLLLTGGVSMGKYDLVEQVLSELGAEFFFTGAAIQPGKPIVFGRVEGKYFFGLPGNPVSTMVTFELFARAIIDALSGALPAPLTFVQARLASDIRTRTGLTRFLPALLSGEFNDARVELLKWQGSGDIAATARANCYIVVPPDREHIAAGEAVSVLLR